MAVPKTTTNDPLLPQVRPILERLAKGRGEGDRLLPPAGYADAFTRHMTALGLAHKRYPHILRHTRATHLLQDGVSIYDVARLLGDNPTTVEKVYAHHSIGRLADTISTSSIELGFESEDPFAHE